MVGYAWSNSSNPPEVRDHANPPYTLLTTHYSLLTTHYSLLTTHYSLIHLDAREPHRLRPFWCLLGDHSGELFRRRNQRLDAELGERRSRLHRAQAFTDRRVELGHDGGRRASRRHDAE